MTQTSLLDSQRRAISSPSSALKDTPAERRSMMHNVRQKAFIVAESARQLYLHCPEEGRVGEWGNETI